MIYKNGEKWDGWKKGLSQLLPVKKKGETPVLKTNPEFYLTDLYKHEKEIAPGKTVPMYCPIMFIQPAYDWTDEDGATCEIRYVEREQMQATRKNQSSLPQQGKFQPEIIEFVDGFLRPDKKKLDFYWFLMNHPDNIMNPAYENPFKKAEHARPFVFQYKDKDKELNLAYDKEILLSNALVLASSGLTKEQARQVYHALNPAAALDASDKAVKLYLISYARTNPKKFMEVCESDDSKFEATINEAKAFGVIKYLPEVRLWKFTKGDGDPFCSVTRGVNEVKALVEWFRVKDSDKQAFKVLEDRLIEARKEKELED